MVFGFRKEIFLKDESDGEFKKQSEEMLTYEQLSNAEQEEINELGWKGDSQNYAECGRLILFYASAEISIPQKGGEPVHTRKLKNYLYLVEKEEKTK